MRIYLNRYYEYLHFDGIRVARVIGIFRIRRDSLIQPPDGKIYLMESLEPLHTGHDGSSNKHNFIKGVPTGRRGCCWFITRESFLRYIPKKEIMVELL